MMRDTIHAGAKDHPITLQQKTTSRNSVGEEVESWSDQHQVMASRKGSHGGEDYEASQKVGHSTVTWRIWYRSDINAGDWRIRDDMDNRIYDIHSIIQLGRRQELELQTEAKDNE